MTTARPAEIVLAVGSGKGGVGKSTVALNLALALRSSGPVGILDADFYGPNVPHMLGLRQKTWTDTWTLARRGGTAAQPILPPVERHGLKIASVGFLLGEDQAFGLSAVGLDLLVKQLVRQVAWGELRFLVVDLPPGTADVAQLLVHELKISGALIVVTPQAVAHLDARKAVTMFRHARVRVLGGVENMSHLACPHCGERIPLFPPVASDRSIWMMDVERLGELPFLPRLSEAAEHGTPLLVSDPGSGWAAALSAIAGRVLARLEAL